MHLPYRIAFTFLLDEQINSYPLSIPIADKLILAFPNREELDYIECNAPFLYTTYPGLEVINE